MYETRNDLPILNGINTARSLTNSGRVVHLSGMNSSGRSKQRASVPPSVKVQPPSQHGNHLVPLNTVYDGTCTMISPGMNLSPTHIPSGGVTRCVPDGTGGCNLIVSLITASNNPTPTKCSCARSGRASSSACSRATSPASYAK